MSDEEINRAIAEHLGWKFIPCRDDGFGRATGERWRDPDGDIGLTPPDYSSDLNAMHEAEKAFTSVQCSFYTYSMREVITEHDASRRTWHATAPQRAEAFLRTVGKWRGEE